MDCRTASELLSPMLDDELPLGERCGLEAHLATCAECAERQRAFAELDDALLALPRLEASSSLLAGIAAEADAHHQANAAVGRNEDEEIITEEFLSELEGECGVSSRCARAGGRRCAACPIARSR